MLPIFGVRVSEMVHLMYVHHIIFTWVWVAEWPPFGKELLTRLSICCLCILTICIFSFFPFGVKGCIWVVTASGPGLCILLLLERLCNMLRFLRL